jgi:hypothetical protein
MKLELKTSSMPDGADYVFPPIFRTSSTPSGGSSWPQFKSLLAFRRCLTFEGKAAPRPI